MKIANKKSLSGRSLVLGVGVNDADYVTRIEKNKKTVWRCPFYNKWGKMLERCYSSKSHKTHPTYIGCSVCPEWHYFSKFRLWMENQNWEGLALDKDLLVKGNRVYGPDTCCFLPQAINNHFMFSGKKINKHLPKGVYLQQSGKYSVEIFISQKRKYYKLFSSLKEACIYCLEKKIEIVESDIISYPELDVRAVFVLNREIKEMQEQINNIQNSLPNLFDNAQLQGIITV